MNCYLCAKQSTQQSAVAACTSCGAGMCMDHFAERQGHQAGGLSYGTCQHVLPAARLAEQRQ